MKVTVPAGRGTIPIWYRELDGHKYVQFAHLWNWEQTVEIPDGSVVLTLADLVAEQNQENP